MRAGPWWGLGLDRRACHEQAFTCMTRLPQNWHQLPQPTLKMWFSLAKRNGARLVWIRGLHLPFTSYVLTKLLVTSLLSSYKEGPVC